MTFDMTTIGSLVECDTAPDAAEFSRRMEEDGHVLLRGVLDTDEVTKVFQDMHGILTKQGLVADGATDLSWSGKSIDEFDDNPMYASSSWWELLDSPTTKALFQRVFGTPIYVGRNAVIRYHVPQDDMHFTRPHQDHYFNPALFSFRTAWIPLEPIDRTVGGLAVAEGSHRAGIREHDEYKDAESANVRGARQQGIPFEDISETWLTADFEPGDVLMFHPDMVHSALPNRSDRIRLSIDTRILPEESERPTQFTKTVLQIREEGLEQVSVYKGKN